LKSGADHSLLPSILPDQLFIGTFFEKIGAFAVAFAGEAAIGVTYNIARAIVQVAVHIAAVRSYVIDLLPIIGILVNFSWRVGNGLAHDLVNDFIDGAWVFRLIHFPAARSIEKETG
jgi:hypothetical protein